jgi:hypothetical protein
MRILHVEYTLRARDLFWMWLGSRVSLVCMCLFAALGLLLLSAPLWHHGPGTTTGPWVGLLSIAIAPFVAPVTLMFATGKIGSCGHRIKLDIDENGLLGWAVPYFRETTWKHLRGARIESRVIALPFSWPFGDAWVVIPARAFNAGEFGAFVSILGDHGFLRDGDHRNVIGKVLGLVMDRGSVSDPTRQSGLLRFPTFIERHPERTSLT